MTSSSASALLSARQVESLRARVRAIPDFPKPGILFRDITPLLADHETLTLTLDAFARHLETQRVDAVLAIESRGFIFGAAVASRIRAAFVPVRKPGKLPAKTERIAYSLEYGQNELEIHSDALQPGERVVVIDDLLATGGTARAAADLARRLGAEVLGHLFVVELCALDGRAALSPDPVVSLLQY